MCCLAIGASKASWSWMFVSMLERLRAIASGVGTTGAPGAGAPFMFWWKFNIEWTRSIKLGCLHLKCLPRSADSPQQRWTRQLLRGTDPLPHPEARQLTANVGKSSPPRASCWSPHAPPPFVEPQLTSSYATDCRRWISFSGKGTNTNLECVYRACHFCAS